MAETQKQVLAGVPKIGFGAHCCPFPGSLVACLEYLGDPCAYDYVMGVTGVAFRRFWQREDGGNIDLMYLAPEPYERVFRALGYAYRVVSPRRKDDMIQAVKESIGQGKPVLAFGIVGPPECGIVAGYDQNGEVLVGYSYFQDAALAGYYEKADWYEKTDWAGWNKDIGFILIGDRQPRPAERAIFVSSLEWAIGLARNPKRPHRPEHTSGLVAYDGWAAGLEVDADYPPGDPKILAWRVMVHGDQTMMLDERRFAASYLRSMVPVAPEAAEDLNAAAFLYDEVAGLGSKIWLWGYSMGPEVGDALSDPTTRREIARAVRFAKEKETAAVTHLEKALAALSKP